MGQQGWTPVAEPTGWTRVPEADFKQSDTSPNDVRTWTDTAVDALPAVGGAVGGIVGGLGGTAFGLGFGGVPGAIGGATFGGGTGEATRQLVQHWRGKEKSAPQTDTEAALDIGKEGLIQGAMEGAGQAVMPIVNKVGTAVYRGYLKPSLAKVNLAKADQIVKDAIKEWIPVSEAGLQRANTAIGKLTQEVNDILANTRGKTVDLSEVADRVRKWATREYSRPGRDPADLAAALKVADRIDKHPSLPTRPGPTTTESVPSRILDAGGQPTMTAVEKAGPPEIITTVDPLTANQVKRDLQTSVADKFGRPGGTATTRAEKRAGYMTRRAVEDVAPGVIDKNARESRLIDVAAAVARATGRESNKSPLIGVNSMVSGAVGGAEYQRSGNIIASAVKALALRLALTPEVATRAAIIAVKTSEKVPGTAVADLARAAVEVARSESQQEP